MPAGSLIEGIAGEHCVEPELQGSELGPKAGKVKLAVVTNESSTTEELPQFTDHCIVGKCTFTQNHRSASCVSNAHAEQSIVVRMIEPFVFVKTDFNVDNERALSSSQLSNDGERVSWIVK
jgi:hypothetical protein